MPQNAIHHKILYIYIISHIQHHLHDLGFNAFQSEVCLRNCMVLKKRGAKLLTICYRDLKHIQPGGQFNSITSRT